MKTKNIITILALILCSISFAQKAKEFEGKISYLHEVKAINPQYDIEQDYGYMGRSSEYTYKKGKYKWVNANAYIQEEIFDNSKALIFWKFSETDTITKLSVSEPNEKVIDYKIMKEGDEVLGKKCDVLIIKAGTDKNTWERRYSFSTETQIDPASFGNCKSNSTDAIYAITNALPLRIVLIFKERKVTYTATKVEKSTVSDKVFEFAAGTKFKEQ